MGRSSRGKREKREVEATRVVAPLRYIVKSDTWEAEVLVEGGRVMTADEPLEDYVGDPWDALADHARGHGWAVRDAAAQAGDPPKVSGLDITSVVIDEAATIPKDKFLKQPTILPKKPPPGIAGQVLIGNPTGNVGWQTPLDEIEKEMKRVADAQAKRDEEMKRLVQEFAVRKAQEGNIDAMNAAIFPRAPTPFTSDQVSQIQRLIRIALDEFRRTMVTEIAREVTQYLGIDHSVARERDRHIQREAEMRGRAVQEMMVMPTMADKEFHNFLEGEPTRRRQK